MRKLIVSEWVSLDFVFDAGLMDQWFQPYESDDRMKLIQDGITAAGAFLYGRTTYEMLAPYWSALKNDEMGVAAKLNAAPKYVVSSTLKDAPWNNSTIVDRDVGGAIAKLKNEPGGDILLFGSATLVHSLNRDLIDEYRFLVHPVVMNRGKRFFRDGAQQTKLDLVSTKTLARGVLLLTYRPQKDQTK